MGCAAARTGQFIGKVAKVGGYASALVSVGVAAYEFKNHKSNAHTWVNLGVAAFGVIGTTAAVSAGAPILLTVSGLYIAYEALHGEDFVDRYLGYDAEI